MNPDFSIIIPTYGRPDEIVGCLEDLCLLEGPSFEVIVVDDGSPEPVGPLLGRFTGAIDLRTVRQENAGPGAARNRGASEARGRYLAFTDDDCRPVPSWLAAYRETLSGGGMLLAGGPVRNALADNPYAAASQDIISFLYESDDGENGFFTSNNFACARSDFEAVGGFDPDLRISSEDRDFCVRFRKEGGTTLAAREAVVMHRHDLDLASFWRQHRRYGIGARKFSEKRVTDGTAPLSIRGPRFYYDLLTYPLRTGGRKAPLRSGLIVLSHIAMASGYYLASRDAD
jgi:GT2 family glycosyltransferase